MQASSFQEINEEVQCGMVGLLFSPHFPCSSLCGICAEGRRRDSSGSDARTVSLLCLGLPRLDDLHCTQYENPSWKGFHSEILQISEQGELEHGV